MITFAILAGSVLLGAVLGLAAVWLGLSLGDDHVIGF